jgi:hypothetical protein
MKQWSQFSKKFFLKASSPEISSGTCFTLRVQDHQLSNGILPVLCNLNPGLLCVNQEVVTTRFKISIPIQIFPRPMLQNFWLLVCQVSSVCFMYISDLITLESRRGKFVKWLWCMKISCQSDKTTFFFPSEVMHKIPSLKVCGILPPQRFSSWGQMDFEFWNTVRSLEVRRRPRWLEIFPLNSTVKEN